MKNEKMHVHKMENSIRKLTSVFDIKWQPEQECIADQLGKEQSDSKLYYSLCVEALQYLVTKVSIT